MHIASLRPHSAVRFISRLLLFAALGALAFASIRWQATLNWLGNYLVCSDPLQAADLVLVMGGDFWGARVLTGAQLGAQGMAPLVLISGPPYAGRPEGELSIEFLVQRGYRASLFAVFSHNQLSTIGEVLALRGELARRHVKRVIVVTSAHHSRRCKLLFQLFCPGIRVLSAPAPDPQYHADGWWKYANSRDLLISEWTKILGSVLVAYPSERVNHWRHSLAGSAQSHLDQKTL